MRTKFFKPSGVCDAYHEAVAILDGRLTRKIDHNTCMVRVDDNNIAITLHGNTIITYGRKGTITLSDGSYRSTTTKDRLNKFLPTGYGVYQAKRVWYLWTNYTKDEFYNGMTLWKGKL